MEKKFQIIYFSISRKTSRRIGPVGSEWYVINWLSNVAAMRRTPWIVYRASVQPALA